MTEIVNGSKNEIHLCEDCVEKDFIMPYFKMSFEELFKKITSSQSLPEAKEEAFRKKRRAINLRRCWACGAQYAEFNIFTELGCPNDYQIFAGQIDKVLKENNNNQSVHSGKLPLQSLEKTRRENRSMLLHLRMENAVKSENYELAASIRDQLRNL